MTNLQKNKHDERGFCIVLNAGSGKGETDRQSDAISGVLAAAGRLHEIFRVDDPAALQKVAEQAVERARQSNWVVVAAGGDGTLNAVAQATLGSGCEFGVIPQGTFNYFARTHGIPTDTSEATRALLRARVYPVQVGLVNGRVFLVNASFGLYRQSLEDREKQKRRFGRSRLIAAWAAVGTILGDYRPVLIKLRRGDEEIELRTLTLFVGNNRLQLEQIGLDTRVVEDGKLAALVLRPVSKLALLGLLVRGAMGQLTKAGGVDSFALTRLTVAPSNPRIHALRIATDGEVAWMHTPIEFRVAPEPLLLLKPNQASPKKEAR
jgi:diacylglycerol kinase family enzyme